MCVFFPACLCGLFQNASFVYDPSVKPVEPKEINSDVLFREGQNLMVSTHFVDLISILPMLNVLYQTTVALITITPASKDGAGLMV